MDTVHLGLWCDVDPSKLPGHNADKIHVMPDSCRVYQGAGWTSWADWLGCDKGSSSPS
jgi:hypothetical protein